MPAPELSRRCHAGNATGRLQIHPPLGTSLYGCQTYLHVLANPCIPLASNVR